MHRRLLITMALLLAAGPAWGQSPPPTDQAEQVKALLERVVQLEKRVAELEAKQTAAPAGTVAISNVSTAQKTEPQEAHAMGHIDQASVAQAETHYPSLQFRGLDNWTCTWRRRSQKKSATSAR